MIFVLCCQRKQFAQLGRACAQHCWVCGSLAGVVLGPPAWECRVVSCACMGDRRVVVVGSRL